MATPRQLRCGGERCRDLTERLSFGVALRSLVPPLLWVPRQCQCDKPARDDLPDNGIESLGGFLGVRMWRGPTAGAAVGLRLAAEAGAPDGR